jgi:hypothetical protein
MRQKVSIMLAVNDAMDKMGMTKTDDIPLFVDWAIKADQRIGSPKSYKKYIQVLRVENCSASLPLGTIQVNAVLLGDHGCDCGTVFDSVYSSADLVLTAATEGLVVIDNRARAQRNPVNWTVQNNKIVFGSNYNNELITAQISGYFAGPDGKPLINENHVEAISAFIQWQRIQRSRFSKSPIKVNAQEFEMEWHRLCADARATDEFGNKAERQDRANIINDPLSGHGITYPGSNSY